VNPAAELEPLPEWYSGEYDFYAPEEMLALVRAGDAVIFARPARRTVQPNRHSGLNWPEPAHATKPNTAVVPARCRAGSTWGAATNASSTLSSRSRRASGEANPSSRLSTSPGYGSTHAARRGVRRRADDRCSARNRGAARVCAAARPRSGKRSSRSGRARNEATATLEICAASARHATARPVMDRPEHPVAATQRQRSGWVRAPSRCSPLRILRRVASRRMSSPSR
jgi:hypothetical protein